MKKFATDIWHVGIIKDRIENILNPDYEIKEDDIVWLPQQPDFCFIADPFGIFVGKRFYIYVEKYDYRNKKGTIECFVYDENCVFIEQGPVLKEKYHLSYPYIKHIANELLLIPEGHQGGTQKIYRASKFPYKFEEIESSFLPFPIIEPSIIYINGFWWLFYARPGDTAMSELNVAFAKEIWGPYYPHYLNPIRKDITSSRPGGTPFLHDQKLYIPVQDCSQSYGGQINILECDILTPTQFRAELIKSIPPNFNHNFKDGAHTLSACGHYTLIDCKYIDPSPQRRWIDLQRKFARMAGRID